MKNIIRGFAVAVFLVVTTSMVPYKMLSYINNELSIYELGSKDLTKIEGKIDYLINTDSIQDSDRSMIISTIADISKHETNIKTLLTYITIYLQIVILVILTVTAILNLVKKDSSKYIGISYLVSCVFLLISIILNMLI